MQRGILSVCEEGCHLTVLEQVLFDLFECFLICCNNNRLFCTYLQDMGTVVLGKVESGKLTKGNSLLLMPNKVMN